MFKTIFKFFAVLLLFVFAIKPILAQEKPNIYFFWGEGCPHCAAEKTYLKSLKEKYPEIDIYDFEIYNSAVNRNYFTKIGEELNTDISGVPLTIIGDKPMIGFSNTLTPEEIENRIIFCIKNSCPDLVAKIVNINPKPVFTPVPSEKPTQSPTQIPTEKTPDKIELPILGVISLKNLSLPIITIILGFLDGFNPCAMWTLLFLISLLLGMENKKRRWVLGSVFIATSAFVYFLFMAAWLNLILFIGFIVWVRILIGLVAIAGGGFNLKSFFTNKEGGCEVAGDEKRQAVFEKLKNITQQKKFLIAMGGIILLAFAVNLVELICSAGLPVIFTQILTLSSLAKWQYYLYMALYIFVFMLDDLFVFFAAMITLEATGITTKYSRITKLIGGMLMIAIGLALIFKPELLMFG